jgi:hypothetical protein
MSEPVSQLVDVSRSDALDLGLLDVVGHHAWHLLRPLRSQLFSSKKVLRLSASIHSSFKMSETVVVVVTQLRWGLLRNCSISVTCTDIGSIVGQKAHPTVTKDIT